MSSTILKDEEESRVRVELEVIIELEDVGLALKSAKKLRKLSKEMDDEESRCFAWAEELANLIEGK